MLSSKFLSLAPKVQKFAPRKKRYRKNLNCGRLEKRFSVKGPTKLDMQGVRRAYPCRRKQQTTSCHDNMLVCAKEYPVATSPFEPMLGLSRGCTKGAVFVAWGEVPDDACVVVGSTLMFVVVSKFHNIRASVCVSPWIVRIPHTRSVPVTCPAHAPLSSVVVC